MAPLEEPTVAEMIRSLGSKFDMMGVTLARIESTAGSYVTQEQRNADLALATVKATRQDERINKLESDRMFTIRTTLTMLIAPIIVGVVVWLLTKGSA